MDNNKDRLWELEYTAFSNKGDINKYIYPEFIEAPNYESALKRLSESGYDQLSLTGKSYDSLEHAHNYKDFYEKLIAPENLVGGMDYDEFHEWLGLGDMDSIIEALEVFKECGKVPDKVEMTKGYLKYKYGWEENS